MNEVAKSVTIKQMAELLKYAVSWADPGDPGHADSACYRTGCLETAAHMVACWLCQARLVKGWDEGIGTAEVRDALGLCNLRHYYHDTAYWERKLRALIKLWNKG